MYSFLRRHDLEMLIGETPLKTLSGTNDYKICGALSIDLVIFRQYIQVLAFDLGWLFNGEGFETNGEIDFRLCGGGRFCRRLGTHGGRW
jgi:hypothetical protein